MTSLGSRLPGFRARRYNKSSYKTEEALFAAIGFGEIGAITIFNRLTEDERREEERAKAAQKQKS